MKAAILTSTQTISIEEKPIPQVKAGSALLRIKSCAVCGSDLRIYHHGNARVKPPRILGHEIAAEVLEVGRGVKKFKVGDRVSVGADIPCGKCVHCKQGRANCCDVNYAMGYQFDGGYAQYLLLDPLVVKLGPVQKFSKSLDFNTAALAEPLACCINGFERCFAPVLAENPNRKGAPAIQGTVVIFGAGPIGLMLAMLAKNYKARDVILIEPSIERIEFAKKLGFKHVLRSSNNAAELIDQVMQITKGAGAQYVLTACPNVEAHEQAVQMVAKRGVVNFFGGLPTSAPAAQISSNAIHYREAYVTGSHGSTPEQHARALRMIEKKQIDVHKLISHTFSLDDILKGFEVSKSRSGMKVVIKPNGD